MSEDKLLSEYEIEAAFRMARETADFFAGLATSLRPGEACGPFCEPAVSGAVGKKISLRILRALRQQRDSFGSRETNAFLPD